MKITNVYEEKLPALKLIGKKYNNNDRNEYGSFGHLWGKWFSKGYFDILATLPPIKENGDSYLGAMRYSNGTLEYWIGIFTEVDSTIPEGFEYIDIDAMKYVTCYIYGNPDNGELYGMEVHNQCLEKIKLNNFTIDENGWCIERYNCPRFTTPDDLGNVILDYMLAVK